MLRAETRGSADPVPVVLVVRLAGVDGPAPLTVELRFPSGLTGEVPVASRFRTKLPFLRIVPGGSGRGRAEDGVDALFTRLLGELVVRP